MSRIKDYLLSQSDRIYGLLDNFPDITVEEDAIDHIVVRGPSIRLLKSLAHTCRTHGFDAAAKQHTAVIKYPQPSLFTV